MPVPSSLIDDTPSVLIEKPSENKVNSTKIEINFLNPYPPKDVCNIQFFFVFFSLGVILVTQIGSVDQ